MDPTVLGYLVLAGGGVLFAVAATFAVRAVSKLALSAPELTRRVAELEGLGGEFRLALWGKNLGDEEYIVHAFDLAGVAGAVHVVSAEPVSRDRVEYIWM